MVNRMLALLMVVAVVGVALNIPLSVDASGHSAERSFSETTVAPGDTVTVTIVARDYGMLGRVVETVPDGFTGPDGSQTVTIRLLAPGPQTRTYTVTALDSAGPHEFEGVFLHQDKSDATVGGASSVTITRSPQSTPMPTPETTPEAAMPTAIRSFSRTSVAPDTQITVTIVADNYGRLGRIVETLPDEFTSSDGDQTVTLRLLEEGPQTAMYTVTAPSGARSYTFSGVLEAQDKSKTVVTGTSSVRVQPSSTNGDNEGPRGSKGPRGDKGATGDPGPQGASGPQGAPGAMGPQGPQGATGLQGAAGSMGLTGLQGPEGAIGAEGSQGPQGPEGSPGAEGSQGSRGPQGASGDQGPQGEPGPQGDAMAMGEPGEQGEQGDAGDPGPKGDTGPAGQIGPAGAPGAEGPSGGGSGLGIVALVISIIAVALVGGVGIMFIAKR